MKFNSTLFFLFISTLLFGQNYNNNFFPVWQDTPWGAGGLTPAGATWSLDGMYDFDTDGQGEFFLSSSWSSAFGNDAMLYESAGNDSFQIIWYQGFAQLDTSATNYSSITTGDLDNDAIPELIVLNDCYAGQDALYIFEFDPVLGVFPAQATASWNVNFPGGVEESGDISVANLDGDPNPELIFSLYSRDPAASHIVIAELAQGSDLSNPVWNVEMDDDSTLTFYSYLAQPTDLDQDGFKEIVVAEWNFNRLVIFENTSMNTWQKASDFFLTLEPFALSNEGATEIDLDNDGLNELFLASTAGYFWVMTNTGSVENLSFADNVHLLSDYKTNGGWRITQVKSGNADSPVGQTPDRPDIYLAATDSTGVASALFDWEYLGGDVTDPNNYSVSSIFTDNLSNGELFKPSKIGIGDADGDGAQEIVFGSFSFDQNKPHIIALESEAATALQPAENHDFPVSSFVLRQNYPNPFNPSTTIQFELFRRTKLSLTIFNGLGQQVKTLLSGTLPSGTHTIEWDGTDDRGALVTSGIYYYQLHSDAFLDTQKMLLLR